MLMQDDDIEFMVRYSLYSSHELACQSFEEGGTLWRRLMAKGLYVQAPKHELTSAFFAAITHEDVAAAREFLAGAFVGDRCHDAAWLNKWFYEENLLDCSIIERIAACEHGSDGGASICPASLAAALSILGERGLDLSVREGLTIASDSDVRVVKNGLHHLIDKAADAASDQQGHLVDLARVYLDQGVTMHESAQGIEESPLAFLLRRDNEEALVPWVNMLVEGGHVQHEHLQECAKIKLTKQQAVAFFEASIARHQFLSVEQTAKKPRP